MTELIGALLDLHIFDAITLVHHQQFSSKYDTLLALLRGTPPYLELDAEMKSALDRAKEIYDLRSRIVHAVYSEHDGEIVIARFSARGKLARSRENLDFLQLRHAASEALKLSSWFERAVRHFRETREGGDSEN